MPAAIVCCLGPELKGTGNFFSSSEDPRQKKHVLGHVHSATQHTHSHIVLLWVSNNIGLPSLVSLAQYPVISRRTPCQLALLKERSHLRDSIFLVQIGQKRYENHENCPKSYKNGLFLTKIHFFHYFPADCSE